MVKEPGSSNVNALGAFYGTSSSAGQRPTGNVIETSGDTTTTPRIAHQRGEQNPRPSDQWRFGKDGKDGGSPFLGRPVEGGRPIGQTH